MKTFTCETHLHRDPADAIHAQSRINRIGQGRHFLQIPGPTPVPDRVLRAIDLPTIRPQSD